MAFDFEAEGFVYDLVVLDQNLEPITQAIARIDDSTWAERQVGASPGRYIIKVASLGDGGGSYSLRRDVFPPRQFGMQSPAVGDFSTGDVEVWNFTKPAGRALLLRITVEGDWPNVNVFYQNGAPYRIGTPQTSPTTSHAILPLTEAPMDLQIVLIKSGDASKYRMELIELP